MTYNEKRAIGRASAPNSTGSITIGPRTTAGKQRSSLNGCKHNITGLHIVLPPDEMEAYNHLSKALIEDLDPRTELQHQTVQKIIDTHFRLNRLGALENNLFQFGVIEHTTSATHDDRVELMLAQTRAWIEGAGSFDILSRYEARLGRQLRRYTREFERLRQQHRSGDPASFGENTAEIVMSNEVAA